MFKNYKVDPKNYPGLSIVNTSGNFSISVNNRKVFGKKSKTKALGMKVDDFNNLDEVKQQAILNGFNEIAKCFYDTRGDTGYMLNGETFAWEIYIPEEKKLEYNEWSKKRTYFKELARRSYEEEKDKIFA